MYNMWLFHVFADSYRLAPMKIYLSNTEQYEQGTICYEWTDPNSHPPQVDDYPCMGKGRYVTISVDRTVPLQPGWRPDDPFTTMSICELSVSSQSGGPNYRG